MHRVLAALLLIATLTATGCIAIGGKHQNETTPPTLGKQLIDLKLAFDQGAISEAEYQAAKDQLIFASPPAKVAQGD